MPGPRAIQRLCKHGNGTSITIPRVMLTIKGWLPGEYILVESIDDESFRLRRPRADDFGPSMHRAMLPAQPGPAQP